jgi:hypothetical protein
MRSARLWCRGAVGPRRVITSSNKVDAYTLTVHGRTRLGQVFVLGPKHCAVAQDWWWTHCAVIDMADATQWQRISLPPSAAATIAPTPIHSLATVVPD